MNNKKINKILIAIFGLTVFSSGLFVYENFWLNKNDESQLIYVAKTNIPAKTTLTADMFSTVPVPNKGALPIYVKDINSVIGKQLKGGLMQNEPLTNMRITDKKDTINNIKIKIEVDPSSITVNKNDYINLYVVMNVNGNIKMEKVFDTKQVDVLQEKNSDGNSISYMTMNVNEDEAKAYYSAKERGKIISVKNNSIDGDMSNKELFNANSDDAKKATTNASNKENSIGVVTKQFKEGDTLDKLAIEHKTTVDNIKKLNNNKEQFNIGENIILPAN